MYKKNIWYILLVSVLLLNVPYVVHAEKKGEFSKSIRKAADKYGFEISVKTILPDGLSGRVLYAGQAEGELFRFFAALDDLGLKFVRKSGLRNVIIVKNLKNRGKAIGGHARNDCIYLRSGFTKKTVYHEMFHVFDDKSEDKTWLRLNHKDFQYTGISYPDRPQSKKQKRDQEKHYRKVKRNFNGDFASNYAMTREREDRAETFACMVNDGKDFADRAAKNPVLYGKMQYIIKLTGKHSLMDSAYWRRKLGSKAFRKK